MAVITRIDRKRNGRRRERTIHLDGAYAFAVTEESFLRFGLAVGRTLDEASVKEIVTRDGVIRAREDAVRLLNHRPRTRKELEDRLAQKGWDADVIEAVTARLEDAGLIDDARFARLWVEERLRLRPAGIAFLRRELRKKGVSPERVEAALAPYKNPEEERVRAYTLLQRRQARYAGLDPEVARRRMLGLLSRRGFTGEAAFGAIGRLLDGIKE